MKTIGMLGGMTWSSTLVYYRVLNELVKERLGGCHSARTVMWSVDFAEHLAIHEKDGWKGVEDEAAAICTALKGAGADFAIFCVNTVHKVFDEVEKRVDLPLLHIADATGAAVRKADIRKIGLIGTRYTMGEDFYKVRLKENFGIETIVPGPEDFKAIDEIIFRELVFDRYEEPALRRCLDAIGRLVDAGAEGIVLGCTELPRLFEGSKIPVPVFDTLRIHSAAAVEEALR